jgi:Na+-transporting methylmalonyl-CoA/oxaloacetate decarboxylase gamma subunit
MSLPVFAVLPLTSAALVLTQQPGNGDNGGQGEDFGKSSPVGLLILLLFLIAVAFLVRSMTKHLKRVPESFDKPDETEAPAEEPSATTAKEPSATTAKEPSEK